MASNSDGRTCGLLDRSRIVRRKVVSSMSEWKGCSLRVPRLAPGREFVDMNLATDGEILRIRMKGMRPIEVALKDIKGGSFNMAIMQNDPANEDSLFIDPRIEELQ